jgi:hypothetical protein
MRSGSLGPVNEGFQGLTKTSSLRSEIRATSGVQVNSHKGMFLGITSPELVDSKELARSNLHLCCDDDDSTLFGEIPSKL